LHEMAVAKRTTIEVRARRGEVRKRMARDEGAWSQSPPWS